MALIKVISQKHFQNIISPTRKRLWFEANSKNFIQPFPRKFNFSVIAKNPDRQNKVLTVMSYVCDFSEVFLNYDIFHHNKTLLWGNFENSFSAIAEKNTILVYLCAAFCQILMAISYTDFPKNLYFKCTMNLKLDHHTYKVNFSKKILLVGLSSKNIFWMTRKKNPSHQKWWFLDFLLTNTLAFWLLHSYELALTE